MIKNDHNFKPIEGKYVNLREIEITDAEFILELRTKGKGAKFLHETSTNVNKQIEYLQRYKQLDNEWYFIVENKMHYPLGCLSAYDIQENSACTGRWVMSKSAKLQESIEGDLLLKNFVFNILEKDNLRTDTKHSNKNMINYFKIWKCDVIDDDGDLYYFNLSKNVYKDVKSLIMRFCK